MCDAAQNCSGQGVCGPEGACECDIGLYMEDCSSKLEKLDFLSYHDKFFSWKSKCFVSLFK